MTSVHNPPAPEPVVDGSTQPRSPSLTRATVADVGRLAGVSGKTVSRVLSGEANVSPATRQRVLDAVQRLRFRPNHLARDLRRGGTSTTVAFVIGDLANPFYSKVASGIEKVLAEHGLTMVIATTGDDPAAESRVVTAMLERRVRGLLIVPIAGDQSYLEGERQLGTPVVCVDRPAQHLAADSVVFANHDATRDAVRSLLAIGHRKIAFVGSSPTLYTHVQRVSGYRDALFEAGIAAVPRWERADAVDTRSASAITDELLAHADPPTAIFAGNNRASMGVLSALRRREQTGGDRHVAFVGFDDFDLAEMLGVTVVASDAVEMGREAARLALARQDEPAAAPHQVVLPAHLIPRGSGEIAPSPTGRR